MSWNPPLAGFRHRTLQSQVRKANRLAIQMVQCKIWTVKAKSPDEMIQMPRLEPSVFTDEMKQTFSSYDSHNSFADIREAYTNASQY